MRLDHRRAIRAQRGFTLIEVLTYLALMGVFLSTLAGAEIMARKLQAREAGYAQALTQVDRLFAELADDCGRASDMRVDGRRLELAGAAKYEFDPATGIVSRDGKAYLTDVHGFAITPSRAALAVEVRVRIGNPKDPALDRAFRRTFFVPSVKARET